MNIFEIDNKKDEDLAGVHFCIRALNTDDRRPHVSNLLISKGYMYGTDGRRLHKYKLQRKVKPGLYRVLKKTQKHIILVKTKYGLKDYPSAAHLFSGKSIDTLDFPCHKNDYIAAITGIIRNTPVYQSINPDYIKDVGAYDCKIEIKKDSVVITASDRVAVVMFLKN